MASDASFIEYVAEQAALGERLTWRKMFGEYALYVDAKVVALVCDNQVFVKPTPAGQELAPAAAALPPYPGAKPHLRLCDELDDGDLLARLLLATAEALPAAKVRTRKAAVAPAAGKQGKAARKLR